MEGDPSKSRERKILVAGTAALVIFAAGIRRFGEIKKNVKEHEILLNGSPRRDPFNRPGSSSQSNPDELE